MRFNRILLLAGYGFIILGVMLASMSMYPDEKVEMDWQELHQNTIENFYGNYTENYYSETETDINRFITGIAIGMLIIMFSIMMLFIPTSYNFGYTLGTMTYPYNGTIATITAQLLPVAAVIIAAYVVIDVLMKAFVFNHKKKSEENGSDSKHDSKS